LTGVQHMIRKGSMTLSANSHLLLGIPRIRTRVQGPAPRGFYTLRPSLCPNTCSSNRWFLSPSNNLDFHQLKVYSKERTRADRVKSQTTPNSSYSMARARGMSNHTGLPF
jgi:hypothetical protein